MRAVEEKSLRHMTQRLVHDLTFFCEVTAFPDGPSRDGRCAHPPAAVKLEDGFSDIVCERHAHKAVERGADILWPEARP